MGPILTAKILAGFVVASAAMGQAGEAGYAERLSLDPQTGQWVRMAAPTPGTEDGDLELARATLARGQARTARRQLQKWLKIYPDSPRFPEALFYLADAEFQLGAYFKAYQRYEELLDSFPGPEMADRVVRREIAVAELLLAGKKRKVLGVPLLPASDEGLDILDNIAVNRAAGSELAEQALRLRADYFYRQGHFQEAEQEYARLAREFPNGPYASLAMLRSAQAAMALFPGIEFDDAPLIEAETRFQQVLQHYPEFAAQQQVPQLLEQIRITRAHKEYATAQWYRKTKRYSAAKFGYESVVKYWPDTQWAQLAEQALQYLPAEAPALLEGPGAVPAPPTVPLGVPMPTGAE